MNLGQDERRILLEALDSYHSKLERQLVEDMGITEGVENQPIQADIIEEDLTIIDELHERVANGDL